MIKIEYKKYLNQVKENPGKIFGLVYIYILVVGFFFGIYYVNNISAIARQSVPPSLPDTVSVEDLKLVEARSIPPVDLATIENPAQDILEHGKTLYTTVCASCHGADGAGNGPAGSAINPPPRNFTIKEGWKNGTTFSGLYKTLEEGIPGTAMIPYDYMPPQDKIALSHFVRNTFVPDPPKIAPDEVTTLDQTYNLKGGSELSAQIPVKNAIDIYLKENRSRTDRIINSMREISSTTTEGGKIFNRITSDKAKAVTTLTFQSDWMKEKDKLRGILASGVNRNGFNSEVMYLNDDELTTLHSYLQSIF